MNTKVHTQYVLTLACADRRGIVRAVSGFLSDRGGNILDSAQFGDVETGQFFMRVHFVDEANYGDGFVREFASVAQEFAMEWQLHDLARKPRVLLMVSKIGHCLNDLLFRNASGQIHGDVRAVVSNHPDFAELTKNHGLPFIHLPVSSDTRAEQEAALEKIINDEKIDLVVLARYMQVFSPGLCQRLRGRAINIHHSFLPSFKGAKPYEQAHQRGVKIIGATAHFITDDLDEGPIIEQDVVRVDHAMSAAELTSVGRDVECVVLARAVNWFLQHRVLLNDGKTVVFR